MLADNVGQPRRNLRVLLALSVVAGVLVLQGNSVVSAVPRSHSRSRATVRNDPNDSQSPLDIHRVVTNRGPRRVTLRVRTWDPFTFSGLRHARSPGFVAWNFDLTGNRGFDRQVAMESTPDGNRCYMFTDTTTRHEPLFHPDHRDLVCKIPRAWLEATKRITFWIWSQIEPRKGPHYLTDRAPDHERRYAGL